MQLRPSKTSTVRPPSPANPPRSCSQTLPTFVAEALAHDEEAFEDLVLPWQPVCRHEASGKQRVCLLLLLRPAAALTGATLFGRPETCETHHDMRHGDHPAVWWGLLPMLSVVVFANPSQLKDENEDEGTDLRLQAFLLRLRTGPARRPRHGLVCHLFKSQWASRGAEGPGADRALKQPQLRRSRTSQARCARRLCCAVLCCNSGVPDMEHGPQNVASLSESSSSSSDGSMPPLHPAFRSPPTPEWPKLCEAESPQEHSAAPPHC